MVTPKSLFLCKKYKNSRKQVKNGSFSAVFWSKCVGTAFRGGTSALAAEKQAFRRLRLECAYREYGILPSEENRPAISTKSVIRFYYTPSGNTPFCFAEWSSHQPHQQKRKQTTARAVCSLFGRSVEVPPFWAEFLHSPLKSKLFDGFVWKTNSILLCRVKFSSATPTKKRTDNHKGCLFSFWSKCGDSNSRPPVPELRFLRFLTIKLYI